MTRLNVIHQTGADTRSNRWRDVVYWVLLIGGCALFLLMNLYTTIKEDDIFHSTIGGGSTQPINSLMDVLRSWVAYYQYDARMANIISFTFNGILGKAVFNVCNTLVFGLMAHLLGRLATGRNSVMALAVLFTYMVTAMPVPGETLLWATGSFNNLWNVTASMALIAYLLWHRDSRPAWWKSLALLLLSMFIGGINEGMTFGVFGGLVLYYLFNRDKVDSTVAVVMTGYLLGVLLLLTCPGAWDRASLEVSHQAGTLSLLMERCRLLLGRSLSYVTPLAAVVILLVALFRFGFRKTLASTPWPLVFLVQLAFVFVVGKDQPRLFFPVSMSALLIVVMALAVLSRRLRWLPLVVILAGLAICLKYYPGNISTMQYYQSFFNQVEQDIRQAPDDQVVLKERIYNGYSRFIKYFNFESWNFLIREETLCRYYGKKNIQFVPDSIYVRFNEDRLLDDARLMPFSASGCPEVLDVTAVPGQQFMAVRLQQDTVSCSYQFALAYGQDGSSLLPVPYFPLLYKGHEYLIFPIIGNNVSKLVFSPFALDGENIDLVRNAPNPGWLEQGDN